ncbi:MAG TPA: hypothetical protein PKK61_08830 [Defluviitaleaceae bacterium]|nr:hypothetical protein [Defluviitaleaceae bacterium]
MDSIFSLIVTWWFKIQAKRNPDKNTKQIIEEFLKENNIEADVKIDNTATPLFASEETKKAILAKLDKLPEHKKQKVLSKIVEKSGLSLDTIKSQIVTPEITALGLHEAGHAKDFDIKKVKAAQIAGKLGRIGGGTVSVLMPKTGLGLIALTQIPELAEELRASRTAYNELKNRFGEEKAKEGLIKYLAPSFASYIGTNIVDPFTTSQGIRSAIKYVVNKSASEMLEEFVKMSEEVSGEELEKYATDVLASIKEVLLNSQNDI